jgi:RHS repeat-associated protein
MRRLSGAGVDFSSNRSRSRSGILSGSYTKAAKLTQGNPEHVPFYIFLVFALIFNLVFTVLPTPNFGTLLPYEVASFPNASANTNYPQSSSKASTGTGNDSVGTASSPGTGSEIVNNSANLPTKTPTTLEAPAFPDAEVNQPLAKQAAAANKLGATLAKQPIFFEPNSGQLDGNVKYFSRNLGYSIYFFDSGPVFNFVRYEPDKATTATGTAPQAGTKPQSESATTIPNFLSARPQVANANLPSQLSAPEAEWKTQQLRMSLKGANPNPTIEGQQALASYSNYFLGKDSSRWRANVANYSNLLYKEVYPGVDLVFYSTQQDQLEYDFKVAPGADYNRIALEFEGARDFKVEAATGDLIFALGQETLRHKAPVVYQTTQNGKRVSIEAKYTLRTNNLIGIKIDETTYDKTLPLVIDPVLVYSTFFRPQFVNDIAVDAAGFMYVVGRVNDALLPTTPGVYQSTLAGFSDAFITKFSPGGDTLIFSTYLGGSSEDAAHALKIDSSGNIYVGGLTLSLNFPLLKAFQTAKGGNNDFFFTKLNSTGTSLLYSTYIGGSGSEEVAGVTIKDWGDLAIDNDGIVYIAHHTFSQDFPVTPNAFQTTFAGSGTTGIGDGVIFKIDPTISGTNSLVYSTYFGGSRNDIIYGIALDVNKDVYITGLTSSVITTDARPFPLTSNAFTRTTTITPGEVRTTAFVSRLNLNLSGSAALLYSTFLRSDFQDLGADVGLSIFVISDTVTYVGGATDSFKFVTTTNALQPRLNPSMYIDFLGNEKFNPRGQDAFLVKITVPSSVLTPSQLLYSSYIGGKTEEGGRGLSRYRESITDLYVEPSGVVYFTGYTISNDYPITRGAFRYVTLGGMITKLFPDNTCDQLIYSSFLGSGRAAGLALDGAGNVYIAGESDVTMPVTKGAYDTNVRNSFIMKLNLSTIFDHVLGLCPNGLDQCAAGNGNYVETHKDLSLNPSEGSPLSLEINRTYNSLDKQKGLLGVGWRFEYDMRVITNADLTVTLINADGRRDLYKAITTTNKFYVPSRANTEMEKTASGYVVTTSNQVVQTFNLAGQLVGLKDRANNTINLTHSATAINIIDNYSRQLKININSTTQLVTSIEDLTGNQPRAVFYTHDAGGRLLRVQDPRDYYTIYEYNPAGLLANRYYPDASGVTNTSRLVVQNLYDCNGFLVTQTVKPKAGAVAYTSYQNFKTGPDTTIFTNTRGFSTTFVVAGGSLLPISTTDALNRSSQVTLNDNDNIAGIVRPNGASSAMTYTAKGKPETIVTTATVQGQPVQHVTEITYNAFNDPLVVKDARDNTTQYTYYPTNKRFDLVTDNRGIQTKYTYDAQNRIQTVVHNFNGPAAERLTLSYEYNPQVGLPSKRTETFQTLVKGSTTPQQVSYVTDYQYTPQGWLKYQSDPYKSSETPVGVSYGHDKLGRVVSMTNQIGKTASFVYDPAGNLSEETNFLGQKTIYVYDYLNRLTKMTREMGPGASNLETNYEYDEANNLVKTIDPKLAETIYGYDALNRVVTVTTPLTNGQQVKTFYAYDVAGNLSTVTRTNIATHGGDQVSKFEYDELNRVVTTTVGTGGTDNPQYVSLNIYDKGGNVLEKRLSKIAGTPSNWNDLNQVAIITATYDAAGRPLFQSLQTGGLTGQTLTTGYTYDDAANSLTVQDPRGIGVVQKLDPAGRVIQQTVNPTSPANFAAAQTGYTYYDGRDLVVRTIDPMGNVADVNYDGLKRPVSAVGYVGPGATNPLTTTTTYLDQASPEVTVVGPAPHNQTGFSRYDRAGRLVRQTVYPGGPALNTDYEYDGQGNVTKVIDPDGYATVMTYDKPGWLLSTVQTATVGGAIQTYTTTMEYDLVGNLRRVVDPRSNEYKTEYDAHNRAVREINAAGHIWVMNYDGLGRLTSSQDPKSQVTSYSYDNASRVQEVNTSGTGIDTINTRFYYDLLMGSPTRMADTIGSANPFTTTYQYDGLSRPVTVTNNQGVVAYRYDNADRRTALSFGTSGQLKGVGYGYDGLSRPVTMSNWLIGSFPTTSTLVYTYSGSRLAGMGYPNGVGAAYGFDGAGRLTGITQTRATSTLYGVNYTLDKRGNRTAASENVNGTSRSLSYVYDELNRLTREVYPNSSQNIITKTHTYDGMSNRTRQEVFSGSSAVTNTYSYNNLDQLTAKTTTGESNPFNLTYTYDLNGNLTSRAGTSGDEYGSVNETTNFIYDGRNRLINWQLAQETNVFGNPLPGYITRTATFGYDGRDDRLSQTFTENNAPSPYPGSNPNKPNYTYIITTNSYSRSYLVDSFSGLPVVLEEQEGAVSTSYLYGLGSTAPLFHTRSDAANTPVWYHGDGIGSIRTLSDGAGNGNTSYSFDAYGNEVATSGGTGTASSRHRYGGEQLDPTGLYYHRARYYDSDLGRYINRDSFAGDMGSPVTGRNRYAYAGANPVRYTDPSGHFFEEAFDFALSGSVAVMLILNGGNTAVVAEQIRQSVQEYPIVASMVGRVAEKGQEQIVKDFIKTSGELALRNTPIVGTGIGLGEAIVGRDVFSGRELSEGERYLNVIFAGVEFAGVARLAAREALSEAGSIGREARLGAAGAEPGGIGSSKPDYELIKPKIDAEMPAAGAGREWPTINEKKSKKVVSQVDEVACGYACGEMLLDMHGSSKLNQQELRKLNNGEPTSNPDSLSFVLNEHEPGVWQGGWLDVTRENLDIMLKFAGKNGSWAATIRQPFDKISHFVVVDGFDKKGNLKIRDPWQGTAYSVTKDTFYNYWDGGMVRRL